MLDDEVEMALLDEVFLLLLLLRRGNDDVMGLRVIGCR